VSLYDFAKLAGIMLSPLTIALALWALAALGLARHRRRWATALASIAFAVLWIGSLPVVADALGRRLESAYPQTSVEATPSADAILVLGGALIGPLPPPRAHYTFGPAVGRLWHVVKLYEAGKAKWIVIAAGNQPDTEGQPVEADAIAEMLVSLGVPPTAIRRETLSRNTMENVQNAQAVLTELRARRVLLVTSAHHMPRAVKSFQKAWQGSSMEVLPSPTDFQVDRFRNRGFMWIPSPSALLSVTNSAKEFAGIALLSII
jgi:uncharacterized SAM-binding protein YcdF (DUF218 family)